MLQRLLCTLTLVTSAIITPLQATPKPDTAIFLNSLPQAIDLYPSYTLTGFYKLSTFRVSKKTFPQDTIDTKSFERFVANPGIYLNNGSLPPSEFNTNLLTAHLGKMILHVRDPRDALVSWIDYTEIQRNHPSTLGLVYPAPPAEYWTWSEEKKANWQIDHFYTYAMTWLDQWAAFIVANPKLQILVTTFEQMATHPLEAFKDIVAFYGTDPNLFTQANLLPMRREQYRQNETDIGQWKRRLTPAQQKRVSEMLNSQTAQLFKWTK